MRVFHESLQIDVSHLFHVKILDYAFNIHCCDTYMLTEQIGNFSMLESLLSFNSLMKLLLLVTAR